MKAFLMTVLLWVTGPAQGASLIEACRNHTQDKEAYSICLQHGKLQPQLGICAEKTLGLEKAFKSRPFRDCLKISYRRNLSIQSIKTCGEMATTSRGFSRCLKSTHPVRLAEVVENP